MNEELEREANADRRRRTARRCYATVGLMVWMAVWWGNVAAASDGLVKAAVMVAAWAWVTAMLVWCLHTAFETMRYYGRVDGEALRAKWADRRRDGIPTPWREG